MGYIIMRAHSIYRLSAVVLVMMAFTAAEAQPTIFNWIAQDPVADWNVDANWQAVAGNFVPNADSFEGESALINNGRTALADVMVPRIAGLEVRNGTLAIPGNGVVETVVDDGNSGGLSIGGAGTINLSGSGQLIVAGSASNLGALRIGGSEATLRVAGDFSNRGALVAEITGQTHSAIEVDGEASLGGILQVSLEGGPPDFGQSWDLVNAGTLDGNFDSIQAAGAAFLPRGLQYQVAQTDGTASLRVGNALIATVDRQSGAGKIENVAGAPIEITSYALRSSNGLLSSENWTDVATSGALGDGWTVANPTNNHLAELNLAGAFSIEVGTSIDLGAPYHGGPVQPADEDLFFQYTTPDGRLESGIVEYTGALNDLVLHVNPEDGSSAIANLSRFIEAPEITGYAVRSESGSLTVDSWVGLADGGQAGDGWVEANPSSEHIAELNLQDSSTFSNGTLISLGNIFATDGQQDLLFEYTTIGGELLRGTVQYGAIPTVGDLPGDCNGDGVIDAADLACVGDIAERDIVLQALNTLPGDLNGNGDVAFADFLVLSANFGQEGLSYVDGNVDLEGAVAFADFLILSANFGQSAAATAAVPEPSAGGLLCVAMFSLFQVVRRRGRP